MNRGTTLSQPRDIAWLDDEMAEVPLLLARSQAEALNAAAHSRGMTAAQGVRCLRRDFLDGVNETDQPARHGQPAATLIGW